MPGPEIRNLSDIEEFIENIVSGNDLYKEARESVMIRLIIIKTAIAVRE